MLLGQRGLQTGLKARQRTVILFKDSSDVREISPLYAAWAPIGKQAVMPIVGSHDKRPFSGVLNILSGEWLTVVTNGFDRFDCQALLRRVRHHQRGWRIGLFINRFEFCLQI